ncbi:MAG: hypothetical protein JXP34_28085, partial [Planctomycetes bacterium]|nr:hypothetical protein [Planctomycetota bacterium]
GIGGETAGKIEQRLESPRIPIVITRKTCGALVLEEEAFAAPPEEPAAARPAPLLACEGPCEGLQGWATPSVPCDPAFGNIAVGWNGPIVYRFRAGKGAAYRIGAGLCEGYHEAPGKRILRVIIDGEVRRTVDPAAEAGRNVPMVVLLPARDRDGDGAIEIRIEAAPDSSDANTILNALWVFAGDADPEERDVIAGTWNDRAIAFEDCGARSGPAGPARNDILRARIRAASGARDAAFEVTIRSNQPILAKDGAIVIGGRTCVATTPAFASAAPIEQGMRLAFAKERVEAGREARLVVSVTRGRDADPKPRGWDDASKARAAAVALWRDAPLPWGRFQVPDPGIQALLDSSVRNIYQAREIKKGLPAFQVGPTCYRGLWVVDGSFIMEAIAFLGRLDEARAGIRYLLSFQRGDGAIMIMNGHWKETGIALWAVSRHARLTDDRAWLREVWPKVMDGFAYIRSMREQTRKTPEAPEAGLIPRGFSDGGLGGVHPEYTNVYWTLVGLRAAADAAAWLGETEDARRIRAEFDDMMAVFRKAAARDAETTPSGIRYVPIRMVDPDHVAPQRAQWAFCHAVFPGQVFAPDDPIVRGNMAAIDADVREGMVYGTGWMAEGIWNYFASFWAHAHLWLGDGGKAARILYAFANHASPLLCWREEQGLGGKGLVGDMPHNWASAEFVRLVRDLLVLERGDEIHLFEGLPRAWVRPGARVALEGILTTFGPVDLSLVVPPAGNRVDIVLQIHGDRPLPRLVVVHKETWTAEGGVQRVEGVKRLELGMEGW